MSTSYSSLDSIVAQQKTILETMFGDPNALSEAAKSYDYFSEDELEQSILTNDTPRGH